MKTSFIGIGSMGGMLARGRSGHARSLSGSRTGLQQKWMPWLAEVPGVHTTSNRELDVGYDLIFLCVAN